MKINELFNESDLNRKIEKVISYAANKEINLKKEISEYIATEKLERSFQTLLEAMQRSINDDNQNEIGVWVSGFYGSGKSSFTKYFGLSFDEKSSVDNQKFKDFFRERLNSSQTKSLLTTVTNQFPAEVIMIDLASTQITGNETAQISKLLFDTVLKKYGYSTNRKVFRLEKLLEERNLINEFKKEFKELAEDDWENSNNDPLFLDATVPKLANKFFPDLYSDENAFNTTSNLEVTSLTDEDTKLMIETVRSKSGKDNIIFVLDEVGQYLGNNNALTLNLDGLAKNLKQIGNGKAWIIATAQQTLTEDVSFANRPDLFKLKDRFPIQIQLDSTDISEIIQKRLLQKSSEGMKVCKELFQKHGQKLIQKIKLDSDFYQSQHNINEQSFCDFYPFFPNQFEILLQLLSALARATGGIGLRSAIKVIQDILNGNGLDEQGFGNQDVGWVANIINIFDILEDDIYTSFTDKKNIMDLVNSEFHKNKLALDIVKAIIILDLIPNIKTNRKNLIALLYNDLNSDLDINSINKEIEVIISNNNIPIKEDNNILSIVTPKLQILMREMDEIIINTGEKKRTFNRIVQEFVSPLEGNLKGGNGSSIKLKTGLRIVDIYNDQILQTDGESLPIQTIIHFVEDENYENKKNELITSSVQESKKNINVIAKKDETFENVLNEINKRTVLAQNYLNESDSETRDFIQSLTQESERKSNELKRIIKDKLESGSVIYSGNITGVTDFKSTIQKIITQAVNDTYYKYKEADQPVSTDHAEKFLKASINLNTIDSTLDPLNLVDKSTGDAEINNGRACILSIKDYLQNSGRIDADTLTKTFRNPPYYWSLDTLRYIIAAMLVGGQIEIHHNSNTITIVNDECLNIFKSNNVFRKCSLNLKNTEITNDQKRIAKDNLVFLTGRDVVQTNQKIADTAITYVKEIQAEIPVYVNKLISIKIKKDEEFEKLKTYINQIIENPEVTSIQFFGSNNAKALELFKWIKKVKDNLVENCIQSFNNIHSKFLFINNIPNTDALNELKSEIKDLEKEFEKEKDAKNFWEIDLKELDQKIDESVSKSCKIINLKNNELINKNSSLINQIPNVNYITKEDLDNFKAKFSKFLIEDVELNENSGPIEGLKEVLDNHYSISSNFSQVYKQITEQIQKVVNDKIKIKKKDSDEFNEVIDIDKNVSNHEDLDKLIDKLNEVKIISKGFNNFKLTFNIKDKN